MKFFILLTLLALFSLCVNAQELSYRDSDSRTPSGNSIFGSGNSSTKKFSKSKWVIFSKTRKNYDKKLRRLIRKQKRQAKKAAKQSDPLLFGHKKYPEKRGILEKKVCPVCKIKH